MPEGSRGRGAGTPSPVVRRLAAVADCVTPLGWTVLALGVVGWAVAHWLGWREFAPLATVCLLLVVLCALFTIGRMPLRVGVEVTPQRVGVGTAAMARYELTNVSRRPVSSMGVELPVGLAAARATTPLLRAGATFDDCVVIPTARRGVVPVGPLRTQRGDPFGLIRRQVVWTDRMELLIHPAIVGIDGVGTGLLRDLEGQSTQDASVADMSFYALREYVPGDDQRHIDQKSTARMSAMAGKPTFYVRQFLDTRRQHVLVVVDVDPTAYDTDAEFEIALSCGASVTARAAQQDMDTSVICGRLRVVKPAQHGALDTYCRAAAAPVALPEAMGLRDEGLVDASLAVVVTGRHTSFERLQRCRALLPGRVGMLVVRVSAGARIARRQIGGVVEVTVGSLADLPRVLREEGSA